MPKFDLNDLSFERVIHATQILSFDCGDEDLNDFFLNDSKQYLSQLLSTTYLFKKENDIVAFFSVANDRLTIADKVSKTIWNKLTRAIPFKKRMKSYPAVKLARIGVSVAFQSQQIGEQILTFLKGWFVDRNKTGCRFIVVDAYNNPKTLNFYLNNGFKFLLNDDSDRTRLMYFDLIVVANAMHNKIQTELLK